MRAGWLNSRAAAAVEIFLVLLITAGHRVFHVIPVDETCRFSPGGRRAAGAVADGSGWLIGAALPEAVR